jgi:hypothetical protein
LAKKTLLGRVDGSLFSSTVSQALPFGCSLCASLTDFLFLSVDNRTLANLGEHTAIDKVHLASSQKVLEMTF